MARLMNGYYGVDFRDEFCSYPAPDCRCVVCSGRQHVPYHWCVCKVCKDKVDTSQRDDYAEEKSPAEEESVVAGKNPHIDRVRKTSLDVKEVKRAYKRMKWEIRVRWQAFILSLLGLIASIFLGTWDIVGGGGGAALGLTFAVLTIVTAVSVIAMFCEAYSLKEVPAKDRYGSRSTRDTDISMFAKLDQMARLLGEVQDAYNDAFQDKVDWDEEQAAQERSKTPS